jgi:hypothetical protein
MRGPGEEPVWEAKIEPRKTLSWRVLWPDGPGVLAILPHTVSGVSGLEENNEA